MSSEAEAKVVEKAKKPARPKAKKETKADSGVTSKKEVGAETRVMSKEEIIGAVKGMTVMDLADLVKALEDEFGVSAAPVVVAAAAPTTAPGQAVEAAAEEEKTEFSVSLQAVGERKIEVIKAVREVTDLGLKQAKDLVEAAPQVVREGVSKEETTTIKEKLEAAGATVEIK